MKYITNLEVLQRSRTLSEKGDIFVFKPAGRGFYYGRVIIPQVQLMPLLPSPSPRKKPDPDWVGNLVYIYDVHSPQKLPVPPLHRDRLLIAPLILDLYCWKLGYVETVASAPLKKDDVLPSHCFVRVPKKDYVDEYGRLLAHRTEPCGTYGLTPFRGFDDEISRALGIPPAPDTPGDRSPGAKRRSS